MMNMHSKYDNMYNNIIFYALICINNHVITTMIYMLLYASLERYNDMARR